MAVLAPEPVLEDMERRLGSPPRGDAEGTTRWLLAACSLGAAALHFSYASSHFAQYWLYGVFFVVTGWVQLLWAVGVVVRRWRWLLLAGYAVNAGVILVWGLSRTVGVVIGPGASSKEAARFPDLLATGLEAVVVLGTMLLLVRPALFSRRVVVRVLTPAAVAGATVLVAGAAAYGMGSHFAAAHDHSHATAALTGKTPCELAGPPASQGQVLDGAGHFHRGPSPQQPLNLGMRMALEAQQSDARAVAEKYPTVADAERAGYRKSTVYVPCIGAHYTNVALAGRFDPSAPSELLYDGTTPGAHIVGLSYLVWHPGGAPQGFVGPNDVWHQHTFNGGLCINNDGLVVGAEATTPAQCTALGGHKIPLTDIWMLHDWVVPGFECSWGVFASECPELGGRTGGTAYDPPDPSGKPIPQG
ncbi:MAG TPA: hypothetical protein VFA83_14175 [Acidimicrobiales bacterium]|nr:hypothetical protein [Acidimicrobiales bacterium]